MPAVKINVSKPVLHWIAGQPGVENLNHELSSRLKDWINESAEPTFSQIQKLSSAIGIPFGYFFLNKPPVENVPLLKFRSVENEEIVEPSRELINTIHYMENVQDWIKDYKKSNSFSELEYVGCLRNEKDSHKIARKILDYLELSSDWYKEHKDKRKAFNFLRERLNYIGITVMMNGVCGNNTHKPLSIKEFRAFCMVDKLAPLIFINSTDSDGAKIFSLLHELVHIWLGIDDLYNDWKQSGISEKNVDQLCNSVASLLIIPDGSFDQEWDNLSLSDISIKIEKLSNIYNCSTSVIARKAFECGYISQKIYDSIIENAIDEYNQQRKRKISGGNYYSTLKSRLDPNFVAALYSSVLEGRTSYTEAYRLTNTNGKTFSELVNHGEYGTV